MATYSIQLAWRKIEWELYQINPSFVKQLPGGATKEAIASLEAEMGVRLPQEVNDFYAIHDGTGRHNTPCRLRLDGSGGVWSLLSLSDIVRTWKLMIDVGADLENNHDMFSEPTGPIKTSWFDRGWIPIADNGNGDHYCLDLSPEVGGDRGQIITWWHEAGATEVVASSFLEWCQMIADGLTSGEYEIYREPRV